MWTNYWRVAWRRLRREKGYALLNIGGLALGLGCALLLALYLHDDLRHDQHFAQADRTYRIVSDLTSAHQHAAQWRTPGPMAPALQNEFPEIEQIVRYYDTAVIVAPTDGGTPYREANAAYVDAAWFEVFDHAFLHGDPATALTAPDGVVLTETLARKYFGTDAAVGRTVLLDAAHPATVTGVLADPPPQAHLTYDLLLPMALLERTGPSWIFEDIGSSIVATYVLLPHDVSPAAFEEKLAAFVARTVGPMWAASDMTITLSLEKLPEIHLFSDRSGAAPRRRNAILFAVIAAFLLGIASINFINLTTARATERAREVGVRKAVGARRSALVGQFLVEAILTAFAAMVVAWLLAYLWLPGFEALAQKTLPRTLLFTPLLLLALIGAALGIGLLAGLYPALVLARFEPVRVLKGTFRHSAEGVWLRRGLVVTQFTLSVGLIVATLVVFAQLDYLQQKSLGFADEQMLVVDFGRDAQVQQHMAALQAELAALPGVRQVTAAANVPGYGAPHAYTVLETAEGDELSENYPTYMVRTGFLDHFDIELLAGRDFQEIGPDAVESAMLINASMAQRLGFAQPADAVGQPFFQWGTQGEIVGVVADFHFASLHQPIAPLTLRPALPRFLRYLALRLDGPQVASTMAALTQIWQQRAPHYPLRYEFLDQHFDALYRSEQRAGQVFGWGALLAIGIACLGLFGLAAFTTAQRTKEIGVRKVLGATVPSLVALLARDVTWLVLTAGLVALPVAYLLLGRWLETFAYHIDLHAGPFLLAAGAALLIAWVTVGYQALRAARRNPVEALRYE